MSFNLQETVAHYIDSNSKVFTVFLDRQKAFDTVWRAGMLYKLYQSNIKGKAWKLIYDCHVDTVSSVLINSERSNWFVVKQGIRQGVSFLGTCIQYS